MLDKEELNYKTFIVPFGKFKGEKISNCPCWWLKGQIDWIKKGKFNPEVLGYNKKEYVKMFKEAHKEMSYKEADRYCEYQKHKSSQPDYEPDDYMMDAIGQDMLH